jgi:hypothetical protein
MPSRFTLRMQFDRHQDPDDIAQQLLRLKFEDRIPADEFAFFFFAEELNNGHETLEEIRDWLDRSRPYRKALIQAGVDISLNPWHSVLHCDRGRRLKPGQRWQRMVGPEGDEAEAVVCPLDPDWQAYFLESLHMYAQEDFRVVWIDDDIRYHNHAPLHWGGCFCPLHVEAFNKRAGVNATREEIVTACLQPGPPHPWRGIWMDMWQETLLAFLSQCREILATGGVEMGLMSSGMEQHGAEGRRWEDWWDVFARGEPPVHRPHFWAYSDTTGPNLIYGIASLDQNRSIQPPIIESGPEIECFPYGRWNKSFRQTFAQMALAHILGSTNLNISLYDFMGNRPDDEPQRAAFLRSVRPVMDWLADAFPMSLRSVGVGAPWTQDMGRLIHTEKGESWRELQCPSRGWAWWLGAAGVAFSARVQPLVNALAGPMAWAFDDATLERWLTSGLLLDGEAAAILVERGFGRLIGMQSATWITQQDALYSVEECLDEAFALRQGAQISVNSWPHTWRMLQGKLAPDVILISDLRTPRQEVVGHGAFLFRNELGGRVAVAPWDASGEGQTMMDIHRSVQIRRMVWWLAGERETGSVEGGAWLVPQFLRDDKRWRGAIWNASPDEIEHFRVHCPADMSHIGKAWHLTPDGARHAVLVEGDAIQLSRPLHQWEVVVIETDGARTQ